jgi:two-component system, LytTR family, response regulator
VIRALLVDDEPPARSRLRALLRGEADVEIVGEAGDGAAAVEAIRAAAPDLVFLDVQMPVLDGLGVVDAIGVDDMPAVVFVTAYDQHALRAFEIGAVDYLLKPFAPSRFRQVLERARQRVGRSDLRAVLAAEPRRHLERVLVRADEHREVLLPVDRVDVIRADGNLVRFLGPDGEFTRRGTLAAIEERLDRAAFLRINRSEIVRVGAIREVQPWFHGDYRVLLTDGATLSWSRRYRAARRSDFEW